MTSCFKIRTENSNMHASFDLCSWDSEYSRGYFLDISKIVEPVTHTQLFLDKFYLLACKEELVKFFLDKCTCSKAMYNRLQNWQDTPILLIFWLYIVFLPMKMKLLFQSVWFTMFFCLLPITPSHSQFLRLSVFKWCKLSCCGGSDKED